MLDVSSRAAALVASFRARLVTAASDALHTAYLAAGLLIAAASAYIEWTVFREILGLGSLAALVIIGSLEVSKVGAILFAREASRARVLTTGLLIAVSATATLGAVGAGTDAPGADRLRAEERDRLVAAYDAQAARLDDQFGARVAQYEARMAQEEATGYGRKYAENQRQRDVARAEWTRQRAALDAAHADTLEALTTQATFRDSPLAQQKYVAAIQRSVRTLGIPISYAAVATLIALLFAATMEAAIYTTFQAFREPLGRALDHQDTLDDVARDTQEKMRRQAGDHEAFRHDLAGRTRAVKDGLSPESGDGLPAPPTV